MFALTGCGHEHEHDHDHDHVPDEYAELENPHAGDRGVAVRGARLFAAMCADCHGVDAAGDGPLATSLDPPPPDLLALVDDPAVTDGYLMWRIAEGGASRGTGMPAFVARLDRPATWAVITHLQCEVAPCLAAGGAKDGSR